MRKKSEIGKGRSLPSPPPTTSKSNLKESEATASSSSSSSTTLQLCSNFVSGARSFAFDFAGESGRVAIRKWSSHKSTCAACTFGLLRARDLLGGSHEELKGIFVDEEAETDFCLHLCAEAAQDLNNVAVVEFSAYVFESGVIASIERDEVRAKELYECAANLHKSPSAFYALLRGGWATLDEKMIKNAASISCSETLNWVANHYLFENNVEKARNMFELGADKGNISAMMSYAELIDTTGGGADVVDRNREKKRKWLSKAAELGSKLARQELLALDDATAAETAAVPPLPPILPFPDNTNGLNQSYINLPYFLSSTSIDEAERYLRLAPHGATVVVSSTLEKVLYLITRITKAAAASWTIRYTIKVSRSGDMYEFVTSNSSKAPPPAKRKARTLDELLPDGFYWWCGDQTIPVEELQNGEEDDDEEPSLCFLDIEATSASDLPTDIQQPCRLYFKLLNKKLEYNRQFIDLCCGRRMVGFSRRSYREASVKIERLQFEKAIHIAGVELDSFTVDPQSEAHERARIHCPMAAATNYQLAYNADADGGLRLFVEQKIDGQRPSVIAVVAGGDLPRLQVDSLMDFWRSVGGTMQCKIRNCGSVDADGRVVMAPANVTIHGEQKVAPPPPLPSTTTTTTTTTPTPQHQHHQKLPQLPSVPEVGNKNTNNQAKELPVIKAAPVTDVGSAARTETQRRREETRVQLWSPSLLSKVWLIKSKFGAFEVDVDLDQAKHTFKGFGDLLSIDGTVREVKSQSSAAMDSTQRRFVLNWTGTFRDVGGDSNSVDGGVASSSSAAAVSSIYVGVEPSPSSPPPPSSSSSLKKLRRSLSKRLQRSLPMTATFEAAFTISPFNTDLQSFDGELQRGLQSERFTVWIGAKAEQRLEEIKLQQSVLSNASPPVSVQRDRVHALDFMSAVLWLSNCNERMASICLIGQDAGIAVLHPAEPKVIADDSIFDKTVPLIMTYVLTAAPFRTRNLLVRLCQVNRCKAADCLSDFSTGHVDADGFYFQLASKPKTPFATIERLMESIGLRPLMSAQAPTLAEEDRSRSLRERVLSSGSSVEDLRSFMFDVSSQNNHNGGGGNGRPQTTTTTTAATTTTTTTASPLLSPRLTMTTFANCLDYPSYWTSKFTERSRTVNFIDVTSTMSEQMESLMQDSSIFFSALGNWRRGPAVGYSVQHGQDNRGLKHLGFEVIKVERVENAVLWRMYAYHRSLLAEKGVERQRKTIRPSTPELRRLFKSIADSFDCERSKLILEGLESFKSWQLQLLASGGGRELSTAANEAYFFHGTAPTTVPIIASEGPDNRVSAKGGLFGAGSYFAENASKSDEYCNQNNGFVRNRLVSPLAPSDNCYKMFLMRASLGFPYVNIESQVPSKEVEIVADMPKQLFRDARRAPLIGSVNKQPADCVIHRCGRRAQATLGASDEATKSFPWKADEYVLYDKAHCYPEFIITYKRK